MNAFAKRVQRAFDNSPSVKHVFTVTIELPELDARNDSDSRVTIDEVVEDKLEEILGVRSLSIESESFWPE